MPPPTLSIIIVNYNGSATIADCIESLFKSHTRHSFEIIVVDNQSQDDSVAILEKIADITLIKSNQNRGFSAGNNIGLRHAKGKFIWLLNNDTVVYPDTIELCVNYLIEHPNVGALSPTLLNQDLSIQPQGSALTSWLFKTKTPRRVGFISGAAFMTRAEILEKTNGLDEAFFFYNEDIDLCKQITRLGYTLILYPKASVIHYGGHSTQTRKPESEAEGLKGGVYLVKKHYPSIIFTLYKAVILAYCRWRLFKLRRLTHSNEQARYIQALNSVIHYIHTLDTRVSD